MSAVCPPGAASTGAKCECRLFFSALPAPPAAAAKFECHLFFRPPAPQQPLRSLRDISVCCPPAPPQPLRSLRVIFFRHPPPPQPLLRSVSCFSPPLRHPISGWRCVCVVLVLSFLLTGALCISLSGWQVLLSFFLSFFLTDPIAFLCLSFFLSDRRTLSPYWERFFLIWPGAVLALLLPWFLSFGGWERFLLTEMRILFDPENDSF